MFPEARGWRRSRRKLDIAARAEQVREVFQDTPWIEELMEYADFEGLRAMLFREDGSMMMIRSRSRSRDAYHLAALLAHQEMLEPGTLGWTETCARAAPRRRVRGMLAAAGAMAGVAVVGLAVLSNLPESNHLSPVQTRQRHQPNGQIAFGLSDVRYVGSISESDARNVGAYLQRRGYFSDKSPATVQVGLENDAYRVQFVVNRASADDVWSQIYFAMLGDEIGLEALRGARVKVDLLDETLAPIKTLPSSALQDFLGNNLYFTAPVTAEDARRAGEYLEEVGYFESGRTFSAHLGRENGTYQLRFVINPAYADNPAIMDEFAEMGRGVALRVSGGEPIVVHLCDPEFRTLKQRRLE
jgi:hypothetical protein